MKKIGIMTDSHSGILSEEAQRLGIKVLPMPFYIGEKVYREGVDLSRDEFYDMLRKGVDVSTSQPSPTEVMDMWKEMLKEYEEQIQKLKELRESGKEPLLYVLSPKVTFDSYAKVNMCRSSYSSYFAGLSTLECFFECSRVYFNLRRIIRMPVEKWWWRYGSFASGYFSSTYFVECGS